MPIYRGTSSVSPKNIILGDRQIARVFLGDDLVWQKNYAQTSKYGFLYNLYAVQDSRDIAPEGWHVPALSEYLALFGLLGTTADGGKLKGLSVEPDEHPRWNEPNVGALNTFDWDGYGGGYREDNGYFDFHGFKGFWWTSDGYIFGLSNDSATYFYHNDYNNKYGASVRLIKNDDVLGDGTMTDASGNTYNTVQIGDTVWMKENLRTTRFRGIPELNDYVDRVIADGGTIADYETLELYFAFILEYDLSSLEIPNVIEDYPWSILTTPAYCIYNYDIPVRPIYHNKLKGLQGGTDDEYYHLTQEEYENLGANNLIIPQLKCEVIKLDPQIDTLRVWYDTNNVTFLDYNPKIWLFREKNYKKKPVVGVGFRKKKWTHEPHLNGVNFDGKNLWSGTIRHPFPSIESTGRETEWELTILPKEKQVVPIEVFKYFYGKTWGDPIVKTILNKDYDYSTNTINFIAATGKRRYLNINQNSSSTSFRVAIVIDNPDETSNDPVIIGEMSDVITIYPNAKYDNDLHKIVSAKWIMSFNKKLRKQ